MHSEKRQIAVLGSTGSIGTQALDVIRSHADLFEVYALTANRNVELLIKQAREFLPEMVVIADEQKYLCLKEALNDLPIKVWAGEDALSQVVQAEPVQMVLTAMVGYSGLKPTLSAIGAGKAIALANKETLVVAGELVTRLAAEKQVPILPVDSEHSAIFQCLAGESNNPIEKIILTASGGPFRTFSQEQLAHVTSKEALKHPNWNMGAKITIDSATLMNKGFEMIEAKWLFGLTTEQIQIVVHPQSIIHSMVQFRDSSIKAQMGLPDMRLPIQYALAYPVRIDSDFERLDFSRYPSLTFEEPDKDKFRCLELAYRVVQKGGNMPCILNAANEIVVAGFLEDKIGFPAMSEIIEQTMEEVSFIASPSLDDYIQTDAEARRKAVVHFVQKNVYICRNTTYTRVFKMKRIALFASGSGSNAENIIRYFLNNNELEFPFIISNRSDAFVHERAKQLSISSFTFKKNDFENGEVLNFLMGNHIDLIVLAGFLLKVPENLLKAYPDRIINIHPALLPKFGGKGMYGSFVHEAVVAAGEKESGITIHYVNENYDEGQIIFQAKCPVSPADSPDDVAAKVHALEYEHFPRVIGEIVSQI